MELVSRRLPARDDDEARRLAAMEGWTDGLPIVVPTPDRVRDMLAGDPRAPDEVLARIPEQRVEVALEQIAVNAVMAGCTPRDLRLVAAIVAAIGHEDFNPHSTTVSGATAPLAIVGGDAVGRYRINSGFNLFGPGPTADLAVGRAVRLVLQNACGGVPGTVDKSTFGHPGKLSYCIGEAGEHLPEGWEPLHVSRGSTAESAVTVASSDAPIQVRNEWATDASELLWALADVMTGHWTGGTWVVVLGPRHAATIAADGLGRDEVAAILHERSARPTSELVARGRVPTSVTDEVVHGVASPEQVLLTVAGGHLYGYSAVLPPWIGGRESQPVTLDLPPDRSELP